MSLSRVIALTSAAALLLTGCQSTSDTAASTEASADSGPALVDGCAQSGAVVEGVTVSDDLNTSPQVSFDGPLSVARTEKLVIVEGSGDVVQELDRVQVAFAYYNGTNGLEIGSTGYEGSLPIVIPADPEIISIPGILRSLLCSTEGSRIVSVIPAAEAFGVDGAPEYGLEAGASLVFVADILDIQPPPEPPLEKLEGDQQEAPAGFPAVEWLATGQPVVTIPDGEVPTDYALATVIKGDGAMVYDGANIIVHYHGVNWNTGEKFDSSWDRAAPSTFSTSGVIAGFRDGLVGQTVGSRVFIIIPPALGYGPSGGTPDGRIGADDTIFFVVDILGLQ